MTGDELAYALNDTIGWLLFGLWFSALAVALRVTWPRFK